MITTCNQAGVGVIVDTIWNHMAGIDGGTGIDGSCESLDDTKALSITSAF